MPSSYECALMSYLTYEIEESNKELKKRFILERRQLFYGNDKNDVRFLFSDLISSSNNHSAKHIFAKFLADKRWKILDSYNTDEFMGFPCAGYQGLAFINHTTREIVIAHRGTIFQHKSNIKDDIEILKGAQGNIPKVLLLEAASFITTIVRKRDADLPNYRIFQTGHSLGGFLAEFGAAYVANPRPIGADVHSNQSSRCLHVSRVADANAITFDSLGSVNILNRLSIPIGIARTTNYLPYPNMFNTANPHDGERRLLFTNGNNQITPIEGQLNVVISHPQIVNFEEALRTVDSHSLLSIIEKINPSTGIPYRDEAIREWPSAVNNFVTQQYPYIPAADQNDQNLPWNMVLLKLGIFAAFAYGHSLTGGVIRVEHIRTGRLDYGSTNELAEALPAAANNLPRSSISEYTHVDTLFNVTRNSLPPPSTDQRTIVASRNSQ